MPLFSSFIGMYSKSRCRGSTIWGAPHRPERLPVVLTIEEVREVIAHLEPPAKLVVQLLYRSGLRLLEALTLRIKDVDFARGQLTVRDPKWKHDRTPMLPASVTAELHEQIVHARLLHQEDLACGWGETWLPDAITRKLPNAARDPRWHWVFHGRLTSSLNALLRGASAPDSSRSIDPGVDDDRLFDHVGEQLSSRSPCRASSMSSRPSGRS